MFESIRVINLNADAQITGMPDDLHTQQPAITKSRAEETLRGITIYFTQKVCSQSIFSAFSPK